MQNGCSYQFLNTRGNVSFSQMLSQSKKDSNTTEVAVGGVVFYQQEPHYHNENNR